MRTLERKPVKEEPKIFEILDSDIVIKIKFYALLIGAMALFLLVCFAIKPQTYGFF